MRQVKTFLYSVSVKEDEATPFGRGRILLALQPIGLPVGRAALLLDLEPASNTAISRLFWASTLERFVIL